jgi:hypothetical protein
VRTTIMTSSEALLRLRRRSARCLVCDRVFFLEGAVLQAHWWGNAVCPGSGQRST